MKIYIGCSLTHAPQEFKDAIAALQDRLRAKHTILDFVGLVAGTPQDVFRHDTQCVLDADLFVAECSYPSIGLGYELATALWHNKPVLALAHADARVTRLVLGVDHPLFTMERYTAYTDIDAHIAACIATLTSH